jgi:hypothetical protein
MTVCMAAFPTKGGTEGRDKAAIPLDGVLGRARLDAHRWE